MLKSKPLLSLLTPALDDLLSAALVSRLGQELGDTRCPGGDMGAGGCVGGVGGRGDRGGGCQSLVLGRGQALGKGGGIYEDETHNDYFDEFLNCGCSFY